MGVTGTGRDVGAAGRHAGMAAGRVIFAILAAIGLIALAGCGRDTLGPRGGASHGSPASRPDADWVEIEHAARGQKVYFNAWAGDSRVNAFIAWSTIELRKRYGINLVHVKTQDTAEAVTRIIAEKSAGRDRDGSVDLVWINGENFAALKARDLLFGPFVPRLPAAKFIDFAGQPVFSSDFTIPVNGFEAPWGLSFFVFTYDSAAIPTPPRNFAELTRWVKAHPGRFTYPAPPDFIGSTFLKQALLSLSPGNEKLFAAPVSPAQFDEVTAPLWAWLDALHPYLWRKGLTFPPNGPAQRQLLADGEVDLSMAFNPSDARAAAASGQLPETARSYGFSSGSVANAHFLAIPANAKAKEAALVTINFLLSAEAQARKSDVRLWGDAGVLVLDRLPEPDKARFTALAEAGHLASADIPGPVLAEPHPSWMEALEKAWLTRYGAK